LDLIVRTCHQGNVNQSALFSTLAWLAASPMSAFAGLPKRPPPSDVLARYEAAADYSEARAGVALLVIEGDAIAFSRAPKGQRIGAPRPIFSGVKGLLCPLVMSAVADGRIGLDDPAGPSFVSQGEHSQVRVRDLLWLTSGLDDARWWNEVENARAPVPDRYAFARSLLVLNAPGRAFQYSGVHAAALGGYLVSQAIDPRRLLTERILKPLGVVARKWSVDGAGQPILSHGMSLGPEQWARIGMLLRDDGRYLGKQIVAPGQLATCLVGSPAMPAYGLGWWLNAPLDAKALSQIPLLIREHLASAAPSDGSLTRPFAPGPPDLFAAIGSYDQRLYVIPSRGLVVVRFALDKNDGALFRDPEFLGMLGF